MLLLLKPAIPFSGLTWESREALDRSHENKANKCISAKGIGSSALPSLKIFFSPVEPSQSRTVFQLISAPAAFLLHYATIK